VAGGATISTAAISQIDGETPFMSAPLAPDFAL
jgi:hypothetical protein